MRGRSFTTSRYVSDGAPDQGRPPRGALRRPDGLGLGRAHVLDDVPEDPVEVVRGVPPDRGADLLDRRNSVVHVLDSLAVDFVVRDEDEVRESRTCTTEF